LAQQVAAARGANDDVQFVRVGTARGYGRASGNLNLTLRTAERLVQSAQATVQGLESPARVAPQRTMAPAAVRAEVTRDRHEDAHGSIRKQAALKLRQSHTPGKVHDTVRGRRTFQQTDEGGYCATMVWLFRSDLR
jgi:hypothetical protein